MQFQSTLPREERLMSYFYYVIGQKISIHAPTRGATKYDCIEWMESHISIHAPTRGATDSWPERIRKDWNFNPRSHERSDLAMERTKTFRNRFQSTLPREERQRNVRHGVQRTTFQSTLPREERLSEH